MRSNAIWAYIVEANASAVLVSTARIISVINIPHANGKDHICNNLALRCNICCSTAGCARKLNMSFNDDNELYWKKSNTHTKISNPNDIISCGMVEKHAFVW